MKVVTASEMARIESASYKEGAVEEEFMNTAGSEVAGVVQHFIAKHHLEPHILILCGKGNNAGDAYVAATLLLSGGFKVEAYALFSMEECSRLCQLQAKRFLNQGGIIHCIASAEEIDFSKGELVVDGLLGTGFKGPLMGILRSTIEKANQSQLPIIAIDIPSGVNGTTGEVDCAIYAQETVFLGLAKSGCFLPSAWEHVGRLHVRNFGLKEQYVREAKEEFHLLEEDEIKLALPPIKRTRHKYEAGYVVGLGGSLGMPGAPILTALAALKSGAGIVRLLHPQGMEAELSGAPYEVIREGYVGTASILEAMERAAALFIGPGIGIEKKTGQLLKTVLERIEKPCVIDAEALTLIAELDIAIPKDAVLTPHVGECRRLLKIAKEDNFSELLQKCQLYVEEKEVTLVLKGSPTFIFQKGLSPFISPLGSPGMATAGSGDVLTGMIAAFLAQGKMPLQAAILGVYIHGMAGEYAAEEKTSYSMVASDIIASLPNVFKTLIPFNKCLQTFF